MKMQRKILKTSNLAHRMLLAQEQIYAKEMAFCVPIGCVRFARYCDKMYSQHLFPYGGLARKMTLTTSPLYSYVTLIYPGSMGWRRAAALVWKNTSPAQLTISSVQQISHLTNFDSFATHCSTQKER